jgi:hypothetical protein
LYKSSTCSLAMSRGKRRSGLQERQDSVRRIVELEGRVRQLETQVGNGVPGVPRSA